MLGDVEHPVLQRFHEIFAVEPESAEALMVTLLRNIEDTGNEISRHISDNFSRIWLIEHVNQHVVGEIYRNDPLKRIFINLKRSDAYQHYKRYNVKCHFLCTRYKLNDDVATILHEASHTAINTRDFFYLDSKEGHRPLNDELARLYIGDMSKKEARGIIETAKALKVPLSPLKEKTLARQLFNQSPQVRGRFLMQNADSFSQIIMELADRVLTREKRATTPVKRVNAEVLALFATRALWQHAAVRHRPGEAMVTQTSPR